MTCGIYMIKNQKNNKKYIGQSIDIEKRKAKHYSLLKNNNHTNQHLQHAWNKYGEKNFIFYTICILEKNTELLNFMEQYYIYKYDSYNNGYNMTIGGDFCPMKDPEISKKISGKKNGMFNVKLYGEDNPFYGRHHTKETKEHLSKKLSGHNNPKAKYTLWNITQCYYSKNDMMRNKNNGYYPRKCFKLKYNKNQVNIGGFIDFYTPQLIYQLIEDFN